MPINIRPPPETDEGEEDAALNTDSGFSRILNLEYLWPAKGDRLFRADNDWERSAEFSNHRISRHVDIWDGYMRSGDCLIEECRRNPADRNNLVYPILYCYRHGLELAMKWIIGMYGRLASVYSADYLDHDLWKLWVACKKVILEVGSDDDSSEVLQAVEQVVKDFHDWDKFSMAFRYSNDKNGVSLKLPDYPIDLENIKKVMQAVRHFFSGVDGELDFNSSNVGYEDEY
jgi:hypothetical protein